MSTVNNLPLLSLDLREPLTGIWSGELEADTETDISGPATLDLDGATFIGTLTGDVEQGRYKGRIVGGAGGLSNVLEAKHYNGADYSTIVRDILTAAGETLSTDSTNYAGQQIANWHRLRGRAADALKCVGDALATTWRVVRDGSVLFAPPPAAELATSYTLETAHHAFDVLTIAPDSSPDVRPGVLLGGRPVADVRTTLTAARLRQDVWFSASDQLTASFGRIVESLVTRRLPYYALWPCTVTAQDGNGLIEVLPADPEVRGSGMGKIKIRNGAPGWVARVPVGAECLVGFEGADPRRPYVAKWLEGTGVTTYTFDGGTKAVARVDDATDIGSWHVIVASGFVTGVTYTPPGGGSPIPLPVFPAAPAPLTGKITSGNTKLKA